MSFFEDMLELVSCQTWRKPEQTPDPRLPSGTMYLRHNSDANEFVRPIESYETHIVYKGRRHIFWWNLDGKPPYTSPYYNGLCESPPKDYHSWSLEKNDLCYRSGAASKEEYHEELSRRLHWIELWKREVDSEPPRYYEGVSSFL